MSDFSNKMKSKFSALSQREKWMIVLLAWGVLIFLLYTFMIKPASSEAKSNNSKVTSLKTKIQTDKLTLAELTVKTNQDPDKELNDELKRLMATSQSLSEQMSAAVEGLVPPSAMAGLLENVLSETHRLKLISLNSMPLEVITIPSEDGEKEEENSGYYIHPVKIVLTGRYFDIKNYLAKLEQMPVKYYWRSFNYQVEKYPQAKLELVVYTLGEKQEFIGG